MSVRVIARIRPLLKAELEKDIIVTAEQTSGETADTKTVVKIPHPKNESELYSFQFNSVYGQETTQSQIFDNEVSSTVKHLFKGYDVTIFAYGVTGTGKTHTMRGGKSLADRGVIPRLLSSIYRRARKIEKDSAGESQVEVSMSYYEIYNDKVFDLFEPPEKRTAAGLPIRDNERGKATVVGLTERPCASLKEFESLYDTANLNRSTSATKLNAHSSRSHAVLSVKLSQTTGDQTRVSIASAIDLAGSEDNRRTDNNKDRLVESAAINKSLFVLAQCVEAISKKQSRIPYRESKMTRILALGQNSSYTMMILNLAPVKSYHLDTLSSLNFANRTKKIEVNEIENQPFFREVPAKSKLDGPLVTSMKPPPSMHRQPLRSKVLSESSNLRDVAASVPKPTKQFSVYSDKAKPAPRSAPIANTSQTRTVMNQPRSPKRPSTEAVSTMSRPAKHARPNEQSKAPMIEQGMSKDAIEALIADAVVRKVTEALAERVEQTTVSQPEPISEELQKRLDALERRVGGQETGRAEGLQYLLMAKQHQVRGEDASALKMYQLALPHFPGNEKLARKMVALQDRIAAKKVEKRSSPQKPASVVSEYDEPVARPALNSKVNMIEEESYHEAQDEAVYEEEDSFAYRPRTKLRRPQTSRSQTAPSAEYSKSLTDRQFQHAEFDSESEDELAAALTANTPRTKHILDIINTRDVSQIKLLKGVGAKRAEALVNCLCDLDDEVRITSLGQLGKLKGVGAKTVENMRLGVFV